MSDARNKGRQKALRYVAHLRAGEPKASPVLLPDAGGNNLLWCINRADRHDPKGVRQMSVRFGVREKGHSACIVAVCAGIDAVRTQRENGLFTRDIFQE